nr:motility-associated protein [Parendozoicomonas sp. Alg238-R29]
MIGGFYLGNGVLAALWQPACILIVIGGSLGSFFGPTPPDVLALTRSYLGKRRGREDYEQLLVLLHDLFQVIRRKGRQALEEHIETPANSDLCKRSGFLDSPRLVTYICDNLWMTNLRQISAKELEALLDSELDAFEVEQMQSVNALKRAADAGRRVLFSGLQPSFVELKRKLQGGATA